MRRASTLTPEFELVIESLSYFGGRGVGRHDGIVVFVPQAAPGDRLRVRLTAKKPRFWEAEIVKILVPSSVRRSPPCPYASRCGGCSWQHITYPAQVESKKKILTDSLRGLRDFSWLPFLEAPGEFHYRNRIQLQIDRERFGFFAKRTRDLVEIKECLIAEPAINSRMKDLGPAEIGTARRLELALREDEHDQGRAEIHLSAGGRDPEVALFSQVNRLQNDVLKKRVLDLVVFEPDWIMDLYCGSGNLTVPLAMKHPRASIVAVELSRSAIERAKRGHLVRPSPNSVGSDATGGGGGAKVFGSHARKVEWIAGDVGRVLAEMKARPGRGLIVLDPPRVGCERQVITQIERHFPYQVIYVSCNPTTFSRDAGRIVEAGHLKLDCVQGLDMFPQTEHIELLASFVRRDLGST